MFDEAHQALRRIDPNPMSRPELCELITDLERLRSRVDERLMAAKATLDSLGDSGADSSAVGRSLGRRSERQAKRDTATARGLAEMPALAESLAEGRLNVEHAAIVADAAEQVSPDVAAELISVAESMPADRFAREAREFVGRHTSAADAEKRHRRQRDRRAAWHKVHGDGSVEIHGRFDKATGEELLAAWKERTDRLWRDDGGRDGTPDDVRSHAQRRADALADLITAPAPDAGATHARFQIHIVFNLPSGSVTWLDGSVVADSVLEAIGPSADVIGHVFDDKGRPLWQGRSKRLATAAQWRSLIVATRGCGHCGADIDRCQAHHLREWLEGGTTDIDNLQLLCHTCHGHEHRGQRHRRRTKPYRAAPPAADHDLRA